MNFQNSFIAQAGVISEAPRFSEILGNVLSFLLSIAVVLAIIAVVIAALRYFFILGNEERAKTAKRSLEVVVIGLLVLFGSMIIISAIGRFLS